MCADERSFGGNETGNVLKSLVEPKGMGKCRESLVWARERHRANQGYLMTRIDKQDRSDPEKAHTNTVPKRGDVLHLFGWDKKFFLPFRALIRRQFACDERHQFIVCGFGEVDGLSPSADTAICPRVLRNVLSLSIALHKAEKIMLHGLFHHHLLYILAIQPWLLKKCHWVIWGCDLYVHEAKLKDWRWRKNEVLWRVCIKRMGHLVTCIQGDAELARKWYGATGQHHNCFMYPSNVYNEMVAETKPHNSVNILIGNSADPSNNHLEILERLTPYQDQDLTIFAPLSYGDKNHAESVTTAGKAIFGDKFVALTEFVPLDQYLEFLGKIDIAIFNHHRQQAMGNMITLLGLGKKVYLRRDVTPWPLFKGLGLSVFDVKQLDVALIEEEAQSRNKDIIADEFSEKRLVEQLKELFR